MHRRNDQYLCLTCKKSVGQKIIGPTLCNTGNEICRRWRDKAVQQGPAEPEPAVMGGAGSRVLTRREEEEETV